MTKAESPSPGDAEDGKFLTDFLKKFPGGDAEEEFRFGRQGRTEGLLDRFPALAVLGPRQVGKTTLAFEIAWKTGALNLDWEHPAGGMCIAALPPRVMAELRVSVGFKP